MSCQRTQLRSHCFIAFEGVEWMKEHVEGVHTVEEAVWLGQVVQGVGQGDGKGGAGRTGVGSG